MNRPLFSVCCCLLFSLTSPAEGPSSSKARIKRIEEGLTDTVLLKGRPVQHYTLVQRMEKYHVRGLSVAVVDRGKVVWSSGYGLADVKSNRAVDARTMFQAGSISKPVAAVAAMKFVQMGRLNLDENVNQQLKSWHVPENEFTKDQKVTLRRLLSHSAGLTVHGFAGYAAGTPVPTVQQVLDGQKPANSDPIRVDVVPGTLFRYSGGGYTVMQLLLTECAGESFAEVLKKTVLDPIGMKNSTYEQPLPAALRDRVAFGYRGDGSPLPGDFHTYPELAAAGLWTTAPDLAKFGIAIQKSREGGSDRVLSQKTTQLMLTRQKEDDGLGFFLEGSGAEERFGHNGANEGFQALMLFTFDGKGLAIMTNSDNGLRVAQELAYSIGAEYGWKDYGPKTRAAVSVSPADLSSVTGKYQIPHGPLLTVQPAGDHLTALVGQDRYDLYPESLNKYFSLSQGVPDLTFSRNAAGKMEVVIGTLHVQREE